MSFESGRSLRWMLALAVAVVSTALANFSAARAEPADVVDQAIEVPAPASEGDARQQSGVVPETALRSRVLDAGPDGAREETLEVSVLGGEVDIPQEVGGEPDVVAGAGAVDQTADQTTGQTVDQTRDQAVDHEDYDPWERFNGRMFSFNRNVDRYALKPVATLWDKILPDPVMQSLKNAFDNLAMPRRLVNKVLQLKWKGAGQELARFGLNTTVGIGGLFDVAKGLGLEASDADTGQTLGRWGVRAGPYLVLPFMPPLTVRDGFGFAVDGALDPFNYVIFPVAALLGLGAGKRVDERALNLDLYETVEESTVDLYSAVRNAYLQKRRNVIDREEHP